MSKFWEELEADYGPRGAGPGGPTWKEIVEGRLWESAQFEAYHALAKCGRADTLFCSCCSETLAIKRWCMKKYCPDCAARRSRLLQAVYVPTVARVKWPLFVTFTIGGGDRWELESMLNAVRQGVVKIRRQRWWKEAVAGGVGSYELKWSERGWHVHWHAVLDCRWLAVTIQPPHPGHSKLVLKRKLKAAQKEVADQWAMAVGYSPGIIYIRRAKPETAQYVVKYSVKPGDFQDPKMPVIELLNGLKGAKLVAPWGSLRKIRRIVKRDLEITRVENREGCKCGGRWQLPHQSPENSGQSEKDPG